MEKQKEALSRIVGTVNAKYGESESFAAQLRFEMSSLNGCYKDSISELNNQFRILAECLENARNRMMVEIETELRLKEKPLQDRLRTFEEARNDAKDLIVMSTEALKMTDQAQFSQAALRIKDRVTMSPVFRLSLSPVEVDQSSYFVADFAKEQRVLNQLKFLPIPCQPEIIETGCFSENNIVHCIWSAVDDEDPLVVDSEMNDPPLSMYSEMGQLPSSIDYFILQYRQKGDDGENGEGPWMTVENIRSFSYDIKGLAFHYPLTEIRVQAWNKALGGSWSNVYSIPTPAFNFSFNADASHPNLKVVSGERVEWDPTANKVQDARVKSAGLNRSVSPARSTTSISPRRSKPKDRFTGESYTVLGDTKFTEEESYFEVEPHPECKTFSIGVTSNSIGRFDQLGRTPTSWCLHVSNWIQNTFVAKHNNKVKNLESTGKPPTRIGVYFNSVSGILSFYNANTKQVVHTFKQVRCNDRMIPGFLIWFGIMQLYTGLQVPSWVLTPVSSVKSESGSSERMSEKI